MSNSTTETQHIIPLEEKVTIEVSGYFHRQMTASYFNTVNLIGAEKTEELCKALADNTVNTLSQDDQTHALTIHTFLSIIKTTETAFKDAKLIVKEDVSIPNEDSES